MQLKPFIKQFLPRSLLGRSLMILIVPILLVQMIATYVFFDRHWSKLNARMAYAVAGEISIIGRSIEQENDTRSLNKVIGFAAQNLGLVINFEKDGRLKKVSNYQELPLWESGGVKALKHEIENKMRKPYSIHVDDNIKGIEVEIKLRNGVLDVTVPERRLYTSSGYVFLLWMIGSSIILLAISIVFMRNQIRPIRKLAAAADRLGKGREVLYFKPEGATEVRQAGQAFLDMQKRIKRQIEQRTTMLAGVSHDLRTPLTRLKLQLAMMGDSPDIEAMKTDVAQMEKMISGYLDFVRGESEEQVALTSLNELIERVIVSAKRQGVEINGTVAREIHAMLRPLAFERCLTNLVNNAGKYARHVWIAADAAEQMLEISIDDDGPGIPPDQYEEVFKPFYRVDTSRNASTGGVGLGLPIAMDIVHAHGGKIWLEKSPQGGLRVAVRVPV